MEITHLPMSGLFRQFDQLRFDIARIQISEPLAVSNCDWCE
jgi:hypothetical protein